MYAIMVLFDWRNEITIKSLGLMKANAKVSERCLGALCRDKFILVSIFANVGTLRLATLNHNTHTFCNVWAKCYETQDHHS